LQVVTLDFRGNIMDVQTTNSLNQNSQSHLHVPEIVRRTDTQALTEMLMEELHSALCWQKQTLAEAAAEIQQLLKQLEENNPKATDSEQKAFVNIGIPPTRRERFLNAMQAGWKETIQEFLEYSYLNIGIATLEGWKETE
jgi:hypothetical protein